MCDVRTIAKRSYRWNRNQCSYYRNAGSVLGMPALAILYERERQFASRSPPSIRIEMAAVYATLALFTLSEISRADTVRGSCREQAYISTFEDFTVRPIVVLDSRFNKRALLAADDRQFSALMAEVDLWLKKRYRSSGVR